MDNARTDNIEVNVYKTKRLTDTRSSGADRCSEREKGAGMKNTIRNRTILLLTAVMLAAGTAWIIFGGAAAVQAASKKSGPMLVKTVTIYQIDYNTKKWTKYLKMDYKYEKGYPTSIQTYDYTNKHTSTSKLRYTFNGKLPKKMKKYNGEGKLEWTVNYFSDGTINNMEGSDEYGKRQRIYQYGNGGPYFTLVMHYNALLDPEQGTPNGSMEEADSISVTTKNGLLKKTVNTGIYANVNEGEEKQWVRFNGLYRADYDSDGILKGTSAKFQYGPSGKEYNFKVKKKDGRITQVIRQNWQRKNGQGEWHDAEKIVFTYTDHKVDKQRYSMMINEHIIGTDNNYYIYSWY